MTVPDSGPKKAASAPLVFDKASIIFVKSASNKGFATSGFSHFIIKTN